MAERLPEIVWRKAEHLAVEKGRTLEDIETITGVSLSALKKRSAEQGWAERRRARMGFLEKMRMLADRAVDQALSGDDIHPDSLCKITKAYKEMTAIPEAEWAETLERMWRAIEDALATEAPDVYPAWRDCSGRVRQRTEEIMAGDGPGKKAAKEKPDKVSPETKKKLTNMLGI